jgi:membrane protein implicated in regulation of membrane protease activity
VWHVFIATLLVALLSGGHASRRTLGLVLTLPLLSVSILSGLAGNPVDATLFAAGAIALSAIGARLSTTPVKRSSTLLDTRHSSAIAPNVFSADS